MSDAKLKALGVVIVFLVGLFMGASAATSTEEARKHAAVKTAWDVEQSCHAILDGCEATLKTCAESLKKGAGNGK